MSYSDYKTRNPWEEGYTNYTGGTEIPIMHLKDSAFVTDPEV